MPEKQSDKGPEIQYHVLQNQAKLIKFVMMLYCFTELKHPEKK